MHSPQIYADDRRWKKIFTTEARRRGETNDNHKGHQGAQYPGARYPGAFSTAANKGEFRKGRFRRYSFRLFMGM